MEWYAYDDGGQQSQSPLHSNLGCIREMGCGAFCGPCWFQLCRAGPIAESHITVKEQVPIVLAEAVWGRLWVGKTILARCDNAAMVAIINQGNSKEPECMHLMCCLSFIAAQFSFNMVASHIKGTENDLANAISRNNLGYIFSRYLQASPIPTALPQELRDLLIVAKPDCTSNHWTKLWTSIFTTA